MNLFSYINAFRQVYKEIQVQRRYNQSFLLPYLQTLETKYQGQFAPEQKHRIEKYYGLFITSFLCSSYKRLDGTALTPEERKRATLFGILTPVGDDLFDIDQLDNESIRAITFNPDTYNATTFSAKVAKEIQAFLLANVPHKAAYIQASANVLDIQMATDAQKSPTISTTELEHITYTKGAASVIIYHQCLDMAADLPMQKALFCIGSLYQLGNDIFDVYKDVRDNIYTLVNTCKNVTDLKKQFLQRVREQNNAIMSLPYSQQNKKAFCIVMNTINARSIVALNQFIALQQKNNGPINWWQLSRKNMIVDMEKPLNILRWLYYIWKLPKLLPS
jgi:hypothetical protein